MNGTDAQNRCDIAGKIQRPRSRWVWTGITVALVAASGIAIREVSGPQAAAQQPAVRPGSPTAQARPGINAGAAAPTRPVAAAAPQAAAPAAAQPAGLPAANTLQVMAVVNAEQITRVDLGRECIRRYGEEVLETMVNRQLIADACVKQGIQVTEADVTAEIDRVAQRFGLSRDRWISLLRDERGFSEEQYRREVIWPMLALRQVAGPQIEITPQEEKKAFESEFGEKIQARLIAVDSQQKAEQVRAQAIANPNAFGDLSKQHSVDAAVASAFGVIPPIRKHLGDAHLEQVAFALQPGQISEVVQVANMYYIIKCDKRLPQQFLSGQQLAEQQARLKERLKENKLRAASATFFEGVQKTAQIVNVLNDPQKQQQMPGVAATVNGRPISLQLLAEECLARHGTEVLDGEINRKILQQELNKKRLAIADQEIDAEIDRAADSYGFQTPDGKPDRNKWLATVTEQPGATVDLYIRDAVWPSVALKKLVGARVQISEEDLQKSYESNYGERVETLAIVLSDQRQAQKVWDLARHNPTDAFFAELAQQYSVEPASRGNGGKVPPIRKFGGSPVIEEAAFKLKNGELSGIVAVEKQYIIMRCLGRTRPIQPEFASVKDNLTKDIQEKKLRVAMSKEFERLREVAQVDNFLARTTQSGAAPGGFPGALPPAVGRAAGPIAQPGAVGTVTPAAAFAPAGQPTGRNVAPATAPRAGASRAMAR